MNVLFNNTLPASQPLLSPLTSTRHSLFLSSACVTRAAELRDLLWRCQIPPRPPDPSWSMPAHISHENTCQLVWKRDGEMWWAKPLRQTISAYSAATLSFSYISDRPGQQLNPEGLQPRSIFLLWKFPRSFFTFAEARIYSQILNS